MLKVYRNNLLIFMLFFSVLACSETKKEAFNLPIKESDFIALMAEIHLAEAAVTMNKKDKSTNFPFELDYLYTSILKKYDLEQAALENALLELAAHPAQMQSVFEKVESKIKTIEVEMQKE